MSGDPDLVIIGAGIAGLTAATHSARLGLNTTVVAEMGVGGQIMNAPRIDNYPGFPDGIGGHELGPILHEQAEAAGAEFLFDAIEAIEIDGDRRIVRGAAETLAARAVIVAAGSSHRKLGIPGEERLIGHGVSHCASCDGPLFRGKRVIVVGGGDAAFDEALILSEFVGRAVILCRADTPRAQKVLRDRVAAVANVEIRFSTIIEEIAGEDGVASVRQRDVGTGVVTTEPVDGVFVYVGLEPNTGFLGDLVALDGDRRIVVDPMMATSVPGVFAAGDIRAGSIAMLAAVAGDGATAAIAAARYLARQPR